jgi:protein pelota
MIRPGDLVGASTTRRDPEAPSEAKAAEKERRRVWLVVKTEQVEFHGFGTQHVRVTGPIVEGPFDQGRHHTLDLGEGTELTLQKDDWSGGDESLLEEGQQAAGEPVVVVASVDWGEATLVRLRGRMVQPIADIRRTLPGKRYGGAGTEKARTEYRDEVATLLIRESEGAAGVIVAGPGFFKEDLGKAIQEQSPTVAAKVKLIATAESGGQGVQELLKSGAGSALLRGSVAAEEAGLVERLVTALGGGRRAAIGPKETEAALGAGAVETLLVGESHLPAPEIARILDVARSGRVRVFIVSALGEAGHRLDGLGGVGALLRYDWIPPERATRGSGATKAPN